mgnify:CR=1 FL=1
MKTSKELAASIRWLIDNDIELNNLNEIDHCDVCIAALETVLSQKKMRFKEIEDEILGE